MSGNFDKIKLYVNKNIHFQLLDISKRILNIDDLFGYFFDLLNVSFEHMLNSILLHMWPDKQ